MAHLNPNGTMQQTIRDLNKLFESVDEQLRLIPRLNAKGDLDLKGKRIIRVGRTEQRDDVPSKRELQEKGLFEDPAGHHTARSAIIAPNGIRSKREAKAPDELVTLRQLQAVSSGSTDAVVTTNVDQLVHGYKSFRGLAMAQLAVACTNGLSNQNKDVGSVGGPVGCFIRISGPTAVYSISGFQRHSGAQGGFPGQLIVIFNSTAFSMTLLHDSGLSVATNRLYLPNNGNVVVRQRGSMALLYSTLDARWVAISLL